MIWNIYIILRISLIACIFLVLARHWFFYNIYRQSPIFFIATLEFFKQTFILYFYKQLKKSFTCSIKFIWIKPPNIIKCTLHPQNIYWKKLKPGVSHYLHDNGGMFTKNYNILSDAFIHNTNLTVNKQF